MTTDYNGLSKGAQDRLKMVIDRLCSDRQNSSSRRTAEWDNTPKLSQSDLEAMRLALSDVSADDFVDSIVVLNLIREIDAQEKAGNNVDKLRVSVSRHVERRWSGFVKQLAVAVLSSRLTSKVLNMFPQILHETVLVEQLAASIVNKDFHDFELVNIIGRIAPTKLAEARLLVAALEVHGNFNNELAISLFCALGRGMGWSSWVSLQSILLARPDFAGSFAVPDNEGIHRHESSNLNALRLEMVEAIKPQSTVREVAGLLLELIRPRLGRVGNDLLGRPAETRVAYVGSLQAAIGGDPLLRQAAIEVMIWFANGQAAELAQFAAVSLAQPDDYPFLLTLDTHPNRLVRYAARAIRTAKFGDGGEIGGLPNGGGLLKAVAMLGGAVASTDEPARTWIGDRAIERLIEQTIASVESKFAQNYTKHGGEGEDRLLALLFGELSIRFSDLNQALEALARAADAPYHASVSMEYRNVDRHEEGAKGIKGANKFAADLCLIVDPVIDSISLGKRVILIQAKRLYQNRSAPVQPTWFNSFNIDRDQRLQLKKQTDASVYLFLCPPLGGRGVPVIPNQLVGDLSEYKGSGAALAVKQVAVASRSLAEWLTYDALALRVGDSYAELVEKAGGKPGDLPRALLDLPAVEVAVEVKASGKD